MQYANEQTKKKIFQVYRDILKFKEPNPHSFMIGVSEVLRSAVYLCIDG